MEADSFLLYYIKRRIESGDAGLQWSEAPYCGEEDDGTVPCGWLAVEQAALNFESDNRDQIEHELNQLAKGVRGRSVINFSGFKNVVDTYFKLLQSRLKQNAENLCVPLLALIAFTGMFSRRLAEMDANEHILREQNRRDFRHEIYLLSIYGPVMFRSKLDTLTTSDNSYSWDRFCSDSHKLLEHISFCKKRAEASAALLSTSSRVGVVVLCGLAAAAAAYFLIVRRYAEAI
uniref:Apoptosis regulator BAX n=1 Tax=Globodera pallida TaxID=36090 RepID=A0A183BPP9_GLOPA